MVGLVGFLSNSVTAGIFGCFNGLIFVYSYMVLYSLFDMYETDYEEAVAAYQKARISKHIYKNRLLTVDDLVSKSKTPLVSSKIEEV